MEVMTLESTCKDNYLNWYGQLVIVVYKGGVWVHPGKEVYFEKLTLFRISSTF